jgi:hypothetical protein
MANGVEGLTNAIPVIVMGGVVQKVTESAFPSPQRRATKRKKASKKSSKGLFGKNLKIF